MTIKMLEKAAPFRVGDTVTETVPRPRLAIWRERLLSLRWSVPTTHTISLTIKATSTQNAPQRFHHGAKVCDHEGRG